ncbi:cysteinyl-tRNA synthetase [Tilletia horrida]|nr:cysteinyl-tRNA synthetase [Tilletia horrida]
MDGVRIVPDVGSSISASSSKQHDISPWLFEGDDTNNSASASASASASGASGLPLTSTFSTASSSSSSASSRPPLPMTTSSPTPASPAPASASTLPGFPPASPMIQYRPMTSSSTSSASTSSPPSTAVPRGIYPPAFNASSSLMPSPSRSQLASRPITPPRANSLTANNVHDFPSSSPLLGSSPIPSAMASTTTLPATAQGAAPPSQKRSKNPFNFLKKKGSSVLTMKEHPSPPSGPGSSTPANRSAAAAAQAIGLDEEHLLEPEQLAAQNPPSKSGSHRPGRLRLGRPRTRDKESMGTGTFAGAFSSAGLGSGSVAAGGAATGSAAAGNDDDLSAFAAAIGERYGAENGEGGGSAGTYQHPAGSAAFPFGPVTPSNEIDFSLDTNFDQIDDIVDRDAARRARAEGMGTIMPNIGGETSSGYFGTDDSGEGNSMGALPLPKPLPSQLQSAADDKEEAERARGAAAAAAAAASGADGTPSSALGLSPCTSTGGSQFARLSSSTGSPAGSGLMPMGRDSGSSSIGTSSIPAGPGGFIISRAPSLEVRGRSSSVSLLEAAGMGMGGGGTSMSRLGSFAGGRSLGSMGSSSMADSTTLPSQSADSASHSSSRNLPVDQGGASGTGSAAIGQGFPNAGAAMQHPKLLRLHSGPVSTNSNPAFGFGAGASGGRVGGHNGVMRRVSLAEGPSSMQGRYGKSEVSALSTLGSSIGSSYGTNSSITTALDSRASAESSGLSPTSVLGKGALHGQSIGVGPAPHGSLLFERAGSMPLESLRELDGARSGDALERSRMAQNVALRKGSATSAGSRRSGISPKSSFASLPGASRDGQTPNNFGGWNLPSLSAGVADPSYKFPARLNSLGKQDMYQAGSGSGATSSGGAYDSLGLRKASASTSTMGGMSTTPSQNASSTTSRGTQPASTAWMAPDSWAVQPDISKAGLGADEDSEESETDGPPTAGQSGVSGKFDWSGSAVGRRRRSSSAVSYATNGGVVSAAGQGGADADGNRSVAGDGSNLHAPSAFFPEARWAQRKDSAGTEPGYTGSASPRRPSDIEILDTNESYEAGPGPDGALGDHITPTSPTSVFLQQQQSQSSLNPNSGNGGASGPNKADFSPHVAGQATGPSTSGRGGGGAASVSTGAAAVAVAAAGKFLHRPHKHRNARPSTAGSLHSTFRSQMGGGSSAAAAAAAAAAANSSPLANGSSNEAASTFAGADGAFASSGGNSFGPRPGSSHRPSVGGSSEDDNNIVYTTSFVRERESSGFLGRRPNTAMSQGGASFTGSLRQQSHCVRIHRMEGGAFTISCPLYSTAAEIRAIISKKFGGPDAGAYRLFVRDKGSERPLGPSEKPALIQKRRLEQAGYNETDNLENLGRTDLSYLLRFVWRLDSVPTFDSESFGNDEHTFQHLHLQGRNLEMVPIFLYRHADWIVSLDLSGNPMSDIPLDFIQACTNLRSIRLSNLALKRIPQSLRQSETLTYIDVSNNRIPDLSHIALDSAAELLSFKIQNNRLAELPSYFARIETLKYLNISNNRFETFPQVLCEMPFLVDLDVSFNAISSLPQEIGKMVKLQRLVLVGNALESLPSTMSELVSLADIDVRRNMLQDVSVLFRLPSLQSLQISHNNLKNVDAEFGQRLRRLDFGQNQLTKVKIVVPNASELTVLNLTSADIDKFDESLFSQLPNLTDLVLDRNRQFSDLTESVGELRSLVRLSCNNTRLAKLPEAIGKLTKLKTLEVHNNNIKTIPASIWNCGELECINVSANIVQSFPFPPVSGSVDGGDAKTVGPSAIATASPTVQQERKGSGASFTTTPWATGAAAAPLSVSLKKLRLCDNRLTDDVFNVLSRFVCLEVLNLSFNEIYEVPAARLSKNVRLQELYLSGNSLSSIPAEDIIQLRDLQTLYINGNKLQTLPAELGQLRKLVNLDVGNNNLKYNIANWNYDWNWNSNLELRFLNLSGNKRLEIKYKAEMVNGRQKNISDFSRLTNLRLLGLMDVTFTVQSTPDESDNRRVRTSLSQINEMSYGIADTLGKHDSLSIVDVVIPQFRKKSNECLFGLFAGRGHGSLVGSRIANHLAEWVGPRLEWEHKRMTTNGETAIQDVLRRAFLRINKELADMLISEGQRTDSEIVLVDDGKPAVPAGSGSSARHHWCAGASAVLAYMVDKTLYIANAGDALGVISRNRGDAHLISTKHDPSFRDEAMRIRSAEGWVSLLGYVNGKIDVSRSFGYYHLFPIVNAAPAVQKIELTDSDEFVILANRTLWDYMSYQTAVDIARMERDDPMLAAQKLRDFAISFGAEESIMVMVISVADLFFDRHQRRAATSDLLVEKYERPRFRRDLPGDRVLARLPMEIPAPVGQLALVFTDIKNSTSLWETNPGMHAAIRLHTSLLRRQLHIIGGYEVKTEGDAFMVSFPTISSAMHWCFTIQLQLLREDWPQEILDCEDGKEVFDSSGELIYRGLSVRMGIHWGAPVCELDPVSNRMDYFGPIVNRAARISGVADGGQIMASKDVVTELKAVLDSVEDGSEGNVDGEGALTSYRLLQPGINRDVIQLRRLGFGISEVGERKMKGLETPEMLYLVFPTALAGRLEAKPDAPAPQVFEPTVQLLNVDEVKQLGALCLRLEALSAGHVFPGIGGLPPDEALAAASQNGDIASGALPSPRIGASDEGEESALQNSTHTLVPSASSAIEGGASGNADGSAGALVVQDAESRRKVVDAALTLHPELLAFPLRDDATDEEMARILDQLTTRIHNAMSSLVLRRVASCHGVGVDAVTQQLLASLLAG